MQIYKTKCVKKQTFHAKAVENSIYTTGLVTSN